MEELERNEKKSYRVFCMRMWRETEKQKSQANRIESKERHYIIYTVVDVDAKMQYATTHL